MMMERRFKEKICATCEYWDNEIDLHKKITEPEFYNHINMYKKGNK